MYEISMNAMICLQKSMYLVGILCTGSREQVSAGFRSTNPRASSWWAGMGLAYAPVQVSHPPELLPHTWSPVMPSCG